MICLRGAWFLTAGKSAFDKGERCRSSHSFSGQRSFDSKGAIEQRGCTYGFNIQTYPSCCSYCNDTSCWQCLFSAIDSTSTNNSHDPVITTLIHRSLYQSRPKNSIEDVHHEHF